MLEIFPPSLLICPNCKAQIGFSEARHQYECLRCRAIFAVDGELVSLLPTQLDSGKLKEDEAYVKQGMRDIQPWLALAENLGIMRYLLEQILPKFVFHGRLLEVGAGLSLASALIKRSYPETEVIASDVAPSILCKGIEVAKVLGCGADWYMLTDIESLPFQDELFDFVVGSRVVHHLPKPRLALAELWRVLKRGGTYIGVAEPTGSKLVRPLWNHCYLGRGGHELGIEENIYTVQEWITLFQSCGFHSIETALDRDWRYQQHDWLRLFYFKIISFIPEPFVKAFLASRITICAHK